MKLVFFKIENYTGYVIILTKRVCGCTVWSVAPTRYDSMGCSLPGSSVPRSPRQEYWGRLSFPPPGDLPIPGIEPTSPALARGFFTTEPPGKPPFCGCPMLCLVALLCPTLCDPMACSLPGSSVHRDSPGKNI